MNLKIKVSKEQIAYAKILDLGMKIGFLVLVLTFVIYMFNILTPHVPIEELPKYWSKPVNEYMKLTNIHHGWFWITVLYKGDFLNFLGVAMLAGITIVCYLRVIPIFLSKKDYPYTILAFIEIIVLLLAASGILKSGGH